MDQDNPFSGAAAESPAADEPVTDTPASARERWREIIRQQRQSGLAISVFCRQRSIRTVTFYSWRKKLQTPRPQARTRAGGFVAVKLAACASGSGRPGPTTGPLEVRLRGGRRVIVRRGFDAALLAEVIAALETLS